MNDATNIVKPPANKTATDIANRKASAVRRTAMYEKRSAEATILNTNAFLQDPVNVLIHSLIAALATH